MFSLILLVSMWCDQKVRDDIFFLLNKKVLGARSWARVTLALCAHMWITASRSDCLVVGNRPKPVVRVVRIGLTVTKKVEQGICISFPETWALMLRNLRYCHHEVVCLDQRTAANLWILQGKSSARLSAEITEFHCHMRPTPGPKRLLV
jgi:hypothetical protein